MIETHLIKITSTKLYEKDNFQVAISIDYPNITKTLKIWAQYADTDAALYREIKDKENNNEHEIFKSSSSTIKSIISMAKAALVHDRIRQEHTFYLCYGKKRLQALLFIENTPLQKRIDHVNQAFLEICYLATHPCNIQSTVTNHPDSNKNMRGAGSCLLQFAEILASEKKAGIYIEPSPIAIPFYLKQSYQYLHNYGYIIKTKERIMTELSETTIQNLKTA